MRTLKRNTILSVLLNVGEICKDVFGATKSKRHGTLNKLVFDPKEDRKVRQDIRHIAGGQG